MRIRRNDAPVSVVDGKIYVVGGSKECNSSNWMEVFHPKTQTWELVLSPSMEICGSSDPASVGIEGKVYMSGIMKRSSCVINNVLYSYHSISRGFKWFDTNVRSWKILKGLAKLPKFALYASVKLVDYGGKMALLWDKYMPSTRHEKKKIWCAEIALERRNIEEIWGKVEWFGPVLKSPRHKFEHALAATV